MSQDPIKSMPNGETPEPTAGSAKAPVWLFLGLGILLYGGMQYLDANSGGFSPAVYEPYYSEKMVKSFQPPKGGDDPIGRGAAVYVNKGCVACHQPSGLGLPGQFPPLAGSEWVNAAGPNKIIRFVLHGVAGPIEVKGGAYNGAMPPWKDVLTEQEIADVLSYVRNNWGNKAAVVTPAQVKAIKNKVGERATPWSADEVKPLSDTD